MKRFALGLAIIAPALAAASVPFAPASPAPVSPAPASPARETIGQALARTAAEAKAAEAEVAALGRRERSARDEASRLRAQRQRAAAEIGLAETRIAAADLALAASRAAVAAREASLARRRAPLAGLLAGLATMGRRSPVLALADGTSIAELVRVRALIDGTMPVIAKRSAALQAELGEGRRLAAKADAARRVVAASRRTLIDKQQSFAALEGAAIARAAALRASASGADDQMLAGGEALLDLRGAAAAAAAANSAARAVATLPLAPPRPFAPEGRFAPPPMVYLLPSAAPVIEGLGDVSAAGVRARGIRLATPRGSAIVAPAAGRILFAGAFRDHDGIIVIDHGNGWSSLLIDVTATVRRGDRIAAGAPIGRALGDIGLELREGGQTHSPALIAGSSRLLSNSVKTR